MSETRSRCRTKRPIAAVPLRELAVEVAPTAEAKPFDLDAWADEVVTYLLEREGLTALPESDEAA